MKSTILSISLSKFKNATHSQFYESVNSSILKHGIETLYSSKLYPLFRSALDNEQDALHIINQSDTTAVMGEQDNIRNNIFRGFSDFVKSMRNHFDPDIRAAANRLWKVFLHYGNITKRALTDKTADIKDFIAELTGRTDLVEALGKLNASNWCTQLSVENQKYHDLSMERYGEVNHKTEFRMSTARLETDTCYRAIISAVELVVFVGDTNEAINNFIAELNAIITHFKSILARDFARKRGEESKN